MRYVGDQAGAGLKAAESMQRAYEHWFQRMMDVQHHSIELMSERMRKAMELPARFAKCRNPADIADAQADFANTMVSDYFEVGRKVMNVLTDATNKFGQEQTQVIGQQVQQEQSLNAGGSR